MTTLAVGADAQGVRCLLLRDGNVAIDRLFQEGARQRNERQIIDAFIIDSGCEWSQIEQYVSVTLPHSHTSVRVVVTILKTSAWYFGKPCGALPVNQLAELDTLALQEQIRLLKTTSLYS